MVWLVIQDDAAEDRIPRYDAMPYDAEADVKDSALLWSRGLIGTVRGSAGYDPAFDVDADGKITVWEHIHFISNLGRVL